MTTNVDAPPSTQDRTAGAGAPRRPLVVVLLAVIAVAVLAVAVAVGHLWGTGTVSSAGSVSATSVDAGFARDMSTHHTQAVTMAGYERDNTKSPALKTVAYDIETSQYFQLGEMQGWLDTWGLGRESSVPQMAWMGHTGGLESDGLMPGMATPAQMTRLQTMHGTPMDILFLQLMINHHLGGLPMAQYAADHAATPYVRQLAQSMVSVQSSQIAQMEQLLRQLGGSPLAPPIT
ncbi:MAG: DUF305 domain-containing protein [Jatrophihabitantaceae bacterium]